MVYIHVPVTVIRSGCSIGHNPFNLVPVSSLLVKRTFNKLRAGSTSFRVNCGIGCGLVVACVSVFRLYGPKVQINSAKKMLKDDPDQTK